MKRIFNNLKIGVLFALISTQEFFSKDKPVIISDDIKNDIKKIKEPFLVVARGQDKPEYKEVTTIKHKFDNDVEKVNVFSQAFIKEVAGDKATFFIDGAYGFALINPNYKAKVVKEPETLPTATVEEIIKPDNKKTGKDK